MSSEKEETVTVQGTETPVPVESVVGEQAILDRQQAPAQVSAWSQAELPGKVICQEKEAGPEKKQDHLQHIKEERKRELLKGHSALLKRLVLDNPTHREKRVCLSTPVSPNTGVVDLTWDEDRRSSVASPNALKRKRENTSIEDETQANAAAENRPADNSIRSIGSLMITTSDKETRKELQKIAEIVFRGTEIQVTILVEPEPERKDWEEQRTKRRRTTKTITVSKAETDEQTYASMLKRLKGEINVEEIGVTVKGVYETSDGRIKINLTEKGKGNCEKFRTAIEEKLGNKAEAKITTARKKLIITGIDKETTEEKARLALQQQYTEKTACPEDTQVRSFHSNERTNKQTATVLVPETEALHLLQKRKVRIWCLKYGHRAKECKEKAGENNTEKGDRCLKCGRWGHHAKACQNKPHCYECEQQGHRADSMACPKMGHAMLAKLTHELEASVVTASEPHLTLVEKEAWLVDDTGSAAIKITDRRLNITDSGNGSSFAWARTGDMTYISCYISPNISAAAFETRLQELEAFLRTHHGNKLLIGDFNAANRAWRSSTNDRRRQLIIDMTEALGMTLLNTGHSPTFVGSGGTSIVDLAFIDDSAAGRGQTRDGRPYIRRKGERAQTKDRDKLLREQLAGILSRINTIDPSSVSRAIGDAARRSLKKIANNRKPIFWWTDEVGNARQRCNAARRRAGRARDDRKTELWRIYKDERKTLKKEIKKAKS
nr:PREDICTED: uncharacterized protein LOC103312490 [Tribolium castaneum]|eukprot:XP_008191471.1 PREDICTED: uncharacterized protein LOC103312490 [Tribolium castaneum]